MRKLSGFWHKFIVLFSVGLVIFQLYTAGFGVFPSMIQRGVHLFFVLTMLFILKPIKKGVAMDHVPVYDIILALLALFTTGYILTIYKQILWEPTQWIGTMDKACAVILTLLIIEASRRAVGWTFPIMALFFLFYALFGEVFPGEWAHRNFSFDVVFWHLYHTTNGIWGMMVGLSAGMLAVFGIFGSTLALTGGSQTFIKIAQKISGKAVGGPGKVSLIASGLFGMISGSAMANVVATGTFTIPMMEKDGYDKEWSAAISAVGSTGGQIMPPIMGAAAFIMAQLIGKPYTQIAKAAIIPALLYYFGAYIAIHFLSKKLGINGQGIREGIGRIELAIIFVPLAIFVAMLIASYTVTKAAFYSTILAVITAGVCFFIESKDVGTTAKKTGKMCFDIAIDGAQSILSMAGLLAGAQLSIAIISLSGFGVKLSNLVISLGAGHLFACLVLAMLVCFILGMGLPPTAAYVLAAAILAPALIFLGESKLVAHLFVFYFSTLGAITPPVCAAVFLASGIANSNWLKTGMLSVLLAAPAFLVPFTFAYNQGLMLMGNLPNIVICTATAVIGVFFMGVSIAGYIKNQLSLPIRVIMFLGGVMMFAPNNMSSIIGLVVCAASYFIGSRGNKNQVIAG